MAERESVATQIRQARGKRSLTRAGLGERVGVTAADITAFEHGTRLPDSATLARIAGVLELDTARLLAVLRRRAPQTPRWEAQELTRAAPAPAEAQPTHQIGTTPANGVGPEPTRGGHAVAAQEEQIDQPAEDSARPGAKSAPARRTAAQSERAEGGDELTEQIVALAERVSGKRFVYQDGEGWLVAPDECVRAPSRLLAAYALLTNALLAGAPQLGEKEREELLRVHQQLLGGPSVAPATAKRGRQRAAP